MQPEFWPSLAQHLLIGLANGSLFALIALGYTMVYGIVELINFAHGDVFMLGAFLALTLVGWFGLAEAEPAAAAAGIVLMFVLVPLFCAALNVIVDRLVYRPLRSSSRLASLVSAIGASLVLVNVGLFWGGAADVSFPDLLPNRDLLASSGVRFTLKDLLVVVVAVPAMIALSVFVKYTRLGKAMRAAAQDPLAAQLVGIPVERTITTSFALGGGLAGVAGVIYALYINTISFQMGFQNGLYAFTAAVLGGIGNLPGAMLGGLVIGLVRSLGSAYLGERWTSAAVFAILILILVLRPQGLLGSRLREKV
ncbi:MAG TPA: branched-chain amino acid ABC transporter permease [Pirellulales bacterium]|nr:branched-chain amino acid ABC transporter permease [Pirellulales bacterium]